jgi:hypothetical protein
MGLVRPAFWRRQGIAETSIFTSVATATVR